MIEFTYAEYLENWSQNFGDDEQAEYGYWLYGKHIPTTVHRLSEADFCQHLKSVNEAQAAFEEAKENDDVDSMEAALRLSFPHELALLI